MPNIIRYDNVLTNYVQNTNTPIWAKDLVTLSIRNNGVLSDDEMLSLMEELITPPAASTVAMPTSIGTPNPQIKISKLKHFSGVGRLEDNQEIQFLEDGITLLFGYNGTGKSSYFHLLNNLCSGSVRYDIRQDVNEANPQPMSTELEYMVDGTRNTFPWNITNAVPPELAFVRLFDNEYAKRYLQPINSNNYIFDSYGLKIFKCIKNVVKTFKDFCMSMGSTEQELDQLCTAQYSQKIVDTLQQNFKKILGRFGMDYLTVQLSVGNLLEGNAEIKVEFQNGHGIDGILSEAELKCCSLALFLTECQIMQVEEPIIFDDPVNSLDAHLIEEFAKILIDLPSQVIIFTHNVQLQHALIENSSVELFNPCRNWRYPNKRHLKGFDILSNNSMKAGHISLTSEKKCKYYINEADSILQNDPYLSSNNSFDNIVWNLRKAIECMVDEVIYRGTSPLKFRGHSSIPWNKLITMVGMPTQDIEKMRNHYQTLSNGGNHLGYAAQQAPPNPGTLQGIINDLNLIITNAGI